MTGQVKLVTVIVIAIVLERASSWLFSFEANPNFKFHPPSPTPPETGYGGQVFQISIQDNIYSYPFCLAAVD
jgi:hypothetical protein